MDNVYNEEDVKRKIAEIDKRFHLVMILEQFEVRLWINMIRINLSYGLPPIYRNP